MTLAVNAAPRDGSLQASPSSGYLLSTSFLLTAQDWVDLEENYPLTYTFLLGSSTPLRVAGTSSTYQVMHLTSSGT
jgi:hypothetical protein